MQYRTLENMLSLVKPNLSVIPYCRKGTLTGSTKGRLHFDIKKIYQANASRKQAGVAILI
jgi:hypothetical protein